MMKKLYVLMLAALLAFSLTACTGPQPTTETSAGKDTSEAETASTEAPSAETASTEAAAEETASEETSAEETSASESCDLEAVFQGILDKQENSDELVFFPTDNPEKIAGLYVGLSDIDLAQMKFFSPPITGYACEIMLVEVKNAEDVKAVQDVFQARIDAAIDGGACDPEAGAVWEANAQIQVSGNYVAMVVLPDGFTVPENVFE